MEKTIKVLDGIILGGVVLLLVSLISLAVSCVTPAQSQAGAAAFQEYHDTAATLPLDERLAKLEGTLGTLAQDVVDTNKRIVTGVGGALTGNGLLDLVLTATAGAVAGGVGTNVQRNRARVKRGEPVT